VVGVTSSEEFLVFCALNRAVCVQFNPDSFGFKYLLILLFVTKLQLCVTLMSTMLGVELL